MLSIDKVEIDIDPTYIKVKPKLEKVDGINTVSLDIEILKEENDISYQVVVWRHNVDHYEYFYKSELTSGCTHETIKDPILTFIFKELDKYGNITAACPLKVGFYSVRGFKIDNADLPHQLPSGEFRFDFSSYIKIGDMPHEIYTDKYYFTTE